MIIKWKEINSITGINIYFEDMKKYQHGYTLIPPSADCVEDIYNQQQESFLNFNKDVIGLFPVSLWMHNIEVEET